MRRLRSHQVNSFMSDSVPHGTNTGHGFYQSFGSSVMQEYQVSINQTTYVIQPWPFVIAAIIAGIAVIYFRKFWKSNLPITIMLSSAILFDAIIKKIKHRK